MQKGNGPSAVATVDVKIPIQRQYDARLIQLGHAHQAHVCERCWNAAVTLEKLVDRRGFLLQVHPEAQRPAIQQSENRAAVAPDTAEQVTGFRQDCLASEKWSRECLELLPRPAVCAIVAGQGGDQRPRVEQNDVPRHGTRRYCPRSLRYRGLQERSSGVPRMLPIKSPASSAALSNLRDRSRRATYCTMARRASSDLLIRSRRAARLISRSRSCEILTVRTFTVICRKVKVIPQGLQSYH